MTITSTPTAPAAADVRPPETEPIRVPLREAPRAGPIDPAAFRETFDFVRAQPEEMRWATIPWQTDLWEARRLAREQHKPIFMWSMNGKPLRQLPTLSG